MLREMNGRSLSSFKMNISPNIRRNRFSKKVSAGNKKRLEEIQAFLVCIAKINLLLICRVRYQTILWLQK